MKKILAIVILLCALLAGCGNQEPTKTPLTTADAVQIVLNDLNMTIDQLSPHVHTGDFQGNEVYYVYVTVEGEGMSYAIDLYSGEILNIAESDHSH